MSYNGWSNYETWNVALWFDNNAGLYSMFSERAQELWDEHQEENEAKTALAEEMEQYVDENNPLSDDSSHYSDLLQAALDAVDYREIAEHYLSEVDKTEKRSDWPNH